MKQLQEQHFQQYVRQVYEAQMKQQSAQGSAPGSAPAAPIPGGQVQTTPMQGHNAIPQAQVCSVLYIILAMVTV